MEAELAWAAGFFDGEGTTSYFRSKNWYGPRMSITQKGRIPLDRFLAAVGVGKIYIIRKRNGQYSWNCQTKEGVHNVLNKLWPYLCEVKKKQALAVFNFIEENYK